jgi:hypothetical protein
MCVSNMYIYVCIKYVHVKMERMMPISTDRHDLHTNTHTHTHTHVCVCHMYVKLEQMMQASTDRHDSSLSIHSAHVHHALCSVQT